MRADYLPATAVCCDCGHLIHEDQINGCIEGTITHTDDGGNLLVDPFVGYICKECKKRKQEFIRGGIKAAKRRKDELDKQDSSQD